MFLLITKENMFWADANNNQSSSNVWQWSIFINLYIYSKNTHYHDHAPTLHVHVLFFLIHNIGSTGIWSLPLLSQDRETLHFNQQHSVVVWMHQQNYWSIL